MKNDFQQIRRTFVYFLLIDLTGILGECSNRLNYFNLNFVFFGIAQTTCNNGVGRVLYERLPNQQLQGFDDDVVSIFYLKF